MTKSYKLEVAVKPETRSTIKPETRSTIQVLYLKICDTTASFVSSVQTEGASAENRPCGGMRALILMHGETTISMGKSSAHTQCVGPRR